MKRVHECGGGRWGIADLIGCEPKDAAPCAADNTAEQSRFSATCCDAPDDRMYHAEDKTWWRRVGNEWKAAEPPDGWEKIA
jgi:hypothetical protein